MSGFARHSIRGTVSSSFTRHALQEPCRGPPVDEALRGHGRRSPFLQLRRNAYHGHGLCSLFRQLYPLFIEGVRHVELGACVFHHRHHRGDFRLHRHRSRRGGDRQDPVRSVRRPFPGLAGRGAAEKALGGVMHIKLLTIAAAAAFAFAGVAQAQSTMGNKPSVDRAQMKADRDKIEADYKAAKVQCDRMKDNEKEVCEADAKGKENVAKAELENKYEPSQAHARKVDEAKAEHEYKVTKEKCDRNKGKQESACEKEAKAKYEKDRANIKSKYASAERKSATGSTS